MKTKAGKPGSKRNVVTKVKKIPKVMLKKNFRNEKNVKDFWNYCKPYFINKGLCNNEPIILMENDNIF